MKKHGVFITLEGPEGSGKSTHIRLLARHLRRQGQKVLVTREPGGTPFSRRIRRLLLDPKTRIPPLGELFLYETDRVQHMDELILPALAKGWTVLCDRFIDSTQVYQGDGRGLDEKFVARLNRIACRGRLPDLTLVLDVPAWRGLRQAGARKKGRHDRLEKAGLAFHERVRRGFLRLAAQNPRRFRVIRQQKTIAQTQQQVQAVVNAFLRKSRPGLRRGRGLGLKPGLAV